MVWEGGITLFMVFLILSQKQDNRAKMRLTLIKRYENGDSEAAITETITSAAATMKTITLNQTQDGTYVWGFGKYLNNFYIFIQSGQVVRSAVP